MPAAPPLAFLPPRLDPPVLALAQRLLPLALRCGGAITARQVVGGDRLVTAMQAFQEGRSRLLLAFQHGSQYVLETLVDTGAEYNLCRQGLSPEGAWGLARNAIPMEHL